jgi:rhamnose transport system permease protein
LFVLTGVLSGILLTARVGSTRPNIALGWELEVVTMVILGGVSIAGGSGTIPGVVIAVFVLGLVTFGLSLINVPGIAISVIIGILADRVNHASDSWSEIRGFATTESTRSDGPF